MTNNSPLRITLEFRWDSGDRSIGRSFCLHWYRFAVGEPRIYSTTSNRGNWNWTRVKYVSELQQPNAKDEMPIFQFLVFFRTSNNKTFIGLDQRQHFTWTSWTVPARWYGVSRWFALISPHVQRYVLIQPRTTCRRPGILVLVNETDWELLVSSARPLEKCVYE